MPAPSLSRTRTELAAFVRQRRAQLQPETFGIEAGPNRRTKGLRREEVAAIAGVGLTWYTWFEQGREISVSPAFLDNLACGLRLNPSERSYLYFLADRPLVTRMPGDEGTDLEPSIVRLVDGLGLRPAYAKNFMWDLLHWNEAASFVFGDFGDIPAADRNIAWLTFADERLRRTMPDWEDDARRLVARLRADYARSARDDRFRALIERLLRHSEAFDRIWKTQSVLETGAGTRVVDVGGIGPVTFDYTVCRTGETEQTKLVIYAISPDEPQRVRFEADCAGWIAQRTGGSAE
ncbi:helix-turn-helix domain-containing protein [Rhodobacterales bacterium HKCCE2091]|nr:helix-turn-helix domain-containing protein [Rhodobacterales bacterium HKCCE2091]